MRTEKAGGSILWAFPATKGAGRAVRGALLAGSAILGLAAYAANAEAQCVTYADCRGGRICIDGSCVTPRCTRDIDCPADHICENEVCVAPQPRATSDPAAAVPAPADAPAATPAPAGPYPTMWVAAPVGPYPESAASRPPAVESQAASTPTGPGASLLLGTNICIENDDASCDDIDPSFGTSLGLLWRFIPNLATQFDFFYGLLDGDGGVDIDHLGIFVGPRIFLAAGPIDLSAGVGIGWAKRSYSDLYKRDVGSYDLSMEGLSIGLSFAVEHRVLPWMATGVVLRYHVPLFDEYCVEVADLGEACEDVPDDYDMVHEVMFGAHATFYFMPD